MVRSRWRRNAAHTIRSPLTNTAVVIALIHNRPRYFSEIMSELLFWVGPDRILFGSDYALWQPKWLIERFVDFELPEDLAAETGQITLEAKKKILGENAARLYNIDIPGRKKSGAPARISNAGACRDGSVRSLDPL